LTLKVTGCIEGDEAAVGDGDPMGVARQVGEHRFGSPERPLRVDHPLGLTQRCEPGTERFGIGERLPSLDDRLQLADIAYQNKAVIYDLLFKASAETMLTIAADPRHLGRGSGLVP
jgi:hypothetical protein